MRRDFDDRTPRVEQLMQTSGLKTPGRKHQKRPGAKALQHAADSRRRAAKLKIAKQSRLRAAIRAYWAGESDENPSGGKA